MGPRPELDPIVQPEPTQQAGPVVDAPMAHDTQEEKEMIAAAEKLSAADTGTVAAADPATPRSIIRNKAGVNPNLTPPECLGRLDLEGDTGRKALIEQVQAALRTSHPYVPAPEVIESIEQNFTMTSDDISAVFGYFRELMGTFTSDVVEGVPPHKTVMRASIAPWGGDGAVSDGKVGFAESAAPAGKESSPAEDELLDAYVGEWSEDGTQPHGQGTCNITRNLERDLIPGPFIYCLRVLQIRGRTAH
jgi:hypothetical protein